LFFVLFLKQTFPYFLCGAFLRPAWGGGGGGGGAPQRGTNQRTREPLDAAWPLIKYFPGLGNIMSLLICIIVVRKCNKKFIHSLTLIIVILCFRIRIDSMRIRILHFTSMEIRIHAMLGHISRIFVSISFKFLSFSSEKNLIST
jgi:hypothetical protein